MRTLPFHCREGLDPFKDDHHAHVLLLLRARTQINIERYKEFNELLHTHFVVLDSLSLSIWFGVGRFTDDDTRSWGHEQQTMAGKKTGVEPEASVDSSDGSEAVAVDGHCIVDDGIYDFTRVEIFAALPRS
jgi:hypothetical protein